MNTLDITKLSEIELNALAYDEYIKLQQAQQNINIITQELNRRLNEIKKDVPA